MSDLFRIKDTNKFGTILATDSKGMKVFEVKGGGIEIVSPELIEEVFPFTFSVKFLSTDPSGSKTYSFLGKEGDFEVGDILLYDRKANLGICRVEELNTKSKSATVEFTGYKLQTLKVG